MSRYVLTELALEDLDEIRDRVLEDNGPKVARRILLEQPRTGPLSPEASPEPDETKSTP